MGKTRNTGKLATQIQFDNSNNLVIGTSASSSFNTSGSVNAIGGITGSIFGIGDPTSFSSSISSNLVSIQSVTASNIARLSNLETKSSSVDISVSSINTFTSSNSNTSLNLLTSSLATTGSNSFFGTQVFSGSVYIANDLIVQGSSSIQYISASSVSIGTNIVQLNTATPSVRYAGVSVQDSGSSAGVTGSILWDSLCNRWIYSNPSTIGYSGGMLMSGPRTSTLGTESPLTCNYIAKSGGGDHLYDSCIWEMSGSVGLNTNNPAEKFEINVGGGARYGMAITGEYPYLTFNNCGSSAATARSFALTVTSAEAGDFAIKMSNCKNGNPITDGFDPFRISRAGDITITCSLTIAGCGLIMSGTGALTLPNGTTAQRPGTPNAGMIRFNTISSTTEYYNGCDWYSFSDNYVHNVDVLAVGGGGGGGNNLSGAGGGRTG